MQFWNTMSGINVEVSEFFCSYRVIDYYIWFTGCKLHCSKKNKMKIYFVENNYDI